MAGHQLGDAGRRARSRACTSTRPRRRGSAASAATRAPGIPPQLAGDGQAEAGHLAQGVAAAGRRPCSRARCPGRAAAAGRRGRARSAAAAPPGRCGGRSATEHVPRAELGGEAGLLVGVHQRRRRPGAAAPAISCRSPGWLSCGSTLWAMSDGARAGPSTRRARRRGAQQRQVRRDDGRDDVHDDDGVEVAQPAPGAHPGVGPGPGQRPHGAREGRRRPARRPAPPARPGRAGRVEVAPRHERDVVAGLGQLVRQGGRVRGDAALVGVGGPDDARPSAPRTSIVGADRRRLRHRPRAHDQVGEQGQASRS